MKKHLKAPDPLAAVASAILTISGILGFEDLIKITASDLAILLGSIGTIAASVRHWLTVRKAAATELAGTLGPSDVETLTGDSEGSDEDVQK